VWSGHDPIENRKSTELYSVAELRGGCCSERQTSGNTRRERNIDKHRR